MTNNIILFIYS